MKTKLEQLTAEDWIILRLLRTFAVCQGSSGMHLQVIRRTTMYLALHYSYDLLEQATALIAKDPPCT